MALTDAVHIRDAEAVAEAWHEKMRVVAKTYGLEIADDADVSWLDLDRDVQSAMVEVARELLGENKLAPGRGLWRGMGA